MLKSLKTIRDETGASVQIKDVSFPAPFESGLEYGSPARGTWNIVHIGMLIPQAHEIFVCSSSCLRGVVLTAAEMNASDRFSTVAIREHNLLDGDMEELVIDGVTDILHKLPKMPPVVLLYTTCIHKFMGSDLKLIYSTLRSRFPNVAFTDCYMTPIMRKSGLTPDQIMRRQLYSLLKKCPLNPRSINIIGNYFPTDESSELVELIQKNGFELKDITRCNTYQDYLNMAESSINISYNPVAKAGGETLEKRLGQKHLYLPLCYGFNEITEHLNKLAETLQVPRQDYTCNIERAEQALKSAKKIIGDTPISIDYTATMRPLGLARLLLEHGFHVISVYVDALNEEEKDDFEWLKKNSPNLKLYATVHVKMRVLCRNEEKKVLAVGQKAAYFNSTENFVNIVEGGGMYGFDGICRMADLLVDAFLHKKDTRSLIQMKGLGGECCL